jgi:GNAT superfamily N-acetyltransferase
MRPSVSVRAASDTGLDDARIGEILVEAFVSTYARKMPEVVVTEERKRELRDVATKRVQARVLVAELDEGRGSRVVGTVALFPPGAAGSEAWLPGHADLRHLAVDPACHGHGVSAALLDVAEELARRLDGCRGICLHVRRGAHGVGRIYEARGYRRESAGDLALASVTLDGYRLEFAG